MRTIKKVKHNIVLADQITQEDIDTMPLTPCPICGDKGLTPGKRYWVVSDPVLYCVDHGAKFRDVAMNALKKLDKFQSKEELDAWRFNPKNKAEKEVMSTAIRYFSATGSGKVGDYAAKVAKKLWPWVMG